MAQVTLRFYGRFVYAISNDAATGIRVLAPKFDEESFDVHHPQMSIRRDRLKFKRDQPGDPAPTTAAPTFRAVSDASDLSAAEIVVWDLSGITVSYDVRGDVTLSGNELLDLQEIERIAGRPEALLSDAALDTGPNGKSTAIVNVTAGKGTAQQIGSLPIHYVFVTAHDAGDDRPDESVTDSGGAPVRKRLAELVEFVITLPYDQASLTLRLKKMGGEDGGTVTVVADTLVAFSNLCTPLPRQREYDLEFTQYYDLLTTPRGRDQLVPKGATVLAEGHGCFLQAKINRRA